VNKLNLTVSSSPHIKSSFGVKTAMWNVVIALMPVVFVGIYFFGLNSVRYIGFVGVLHNDRIYFFKAAKENA